MSVAVGNKNGVIMGKEKGIFFVCKQAAARFYRGAMPRNAIAEEARLPFAEREKLRRGQLLALLATANLPLTALILPSTFVPEFDPVAMTALLTNLLLIVASLLLNRCGKVRAGAGLYLFSTITACSIYLFFSPPSSFLFGCYVYAFYGVAVVNSGFLLGRRAPFIFSTLSIGFVSAHVGLHLRDFHALPGFDKGEVYVFALIPDITLFMLGVLSWLGSGSMETALKRADQVDQMASMNEELRAMHEELLAGHRELETANIKLEALATTDGMTGLSNHRAFQERLRLELALAEGTDRPLALLLLDVDHFKAYNDLFGHPAGDKALRLVAGMLRTEVRLTDYPARYGGEEFVIVLPDTDAVEARTLAERLRLSIAAYSFPHRPVTVSIGIALTKDVSRNPEALIAGADAALYRAKRSGRNRVAFSSEPVQRAA